jgi:cytidylate kinase
MAVVTLNGPIGAGGVEVGVEAAKLLKADYVDRLLLAEAAKRIGSTVQVLEIKEQRVVPLRDRLAYFLQTMLERSAMSGAGGEPYFSPGMEYLPAEEYSDLAQEPLTAAQRLKDEHFIEATGAVVKDLARAGNVVIIGRGSNMILRDMPSVLHAGLLAPVERRVTTIMGREHLDKKDAERYVLDMEKARVIYFKKFFKVHPNDASLYHLVVNLGVMSVKVAAEIVAHAAMDLEAAETSRVG